MIMHLNALIKLKLNLANHVRLRNSIFVSNRERFFCSIIVFIKTNILGSVGDAVWDAVGADVNKNQQLNVTFMFDGEPS